MPKFTSDPNPVRLCEGTCGRMTRSSKAFKADHPDTVVRRTVSHCNTCWQEIPGNEPDPVDTAAREARTVALQAERVAAAHKVRETMERMRKERQAAAGRKHLALQRGLVSV